MVQRDIYHAANAADPVLEETTVLRLARQHLPAAGGVTAIDETGGEARAYVIDERYIFKTQRPHRVRERTSLAKAVFHQRAIEKGAPEINVPRVLGYGRDGDVEYVLETRLAGVALRDISLEGEARRAVLRELGRALQRLHSLPLVQFEQSLLFPGDDNEADVQARTCDILRQAAETIEAGGLRWPLAVKPVAFADRLIESARLDPSRSALHANPGPEHVYVDRQSLSFEGIIDFGDAYISHAAFDMRRWSSESDRAALIEGYGSEAELKEPFLQTWRLVLAGGLMATIAGIGPGAARPERREAAFADLPGLVRELW